MYPSKKIDKKKIVMTKETIFPISNFSYQHIAVYHTELIGSVGKKVACCEEKGGLTFTEEDDCVDESADCSRSSPPLLYRIALVATPIKG